jgi:hypothetical protein
MGRREQFTVGRLDVTEGIFVKGVAHNAVIADVTSSAAELNYIDTSVPGTSVASKALVLGANKNTDVLALPVSGLKIGPGAGTAVSASAAEINKLTGLAAVIAAGAAPHAHVIDPAGGATQDAEARTAINAILVALETFGINAAA